MVLVSGSDTPVSDRTSNKLVVRDSSNLGVCAYGNQSLCLITVLCQVCTKWQSTVAYATMQPTGKLQQLGELVPGIKIVIEYRFLLLDSGAHRLIL